MMLHVAHVVKDQLRFTHVDPFEPAALSSLLFCHRLNGGLGLLSAKLQIRLQFLFRINLLGKNSLRIEFIESVNGAGGANPSTAPDI